MSLFSRTDRSALGQWWWTVDRTMLAAFIALIIFGVELVVAASPAVAQRIGLNQYHFVIRHLIVLAPSIILMVWLSGCSPRTIWRFCTVVLIGALAMMVIIPLVGMEIKGAQRWIHIFGFSLQPSEFLKPSFAVIAAWLMAKQKENPGFPGYKLCAALYGISITLLLLQPDLGMSIVVTCIWGGQIFLAGLPFKLMGILIAIAVLGLVMAYFTFSHVQSRIDRYFDPQSGDTYQVQRSLEAFQQGGIFGTGPGQGDVKLYIPDAHADFIFSVAGEELGLFFVLILIMLYTFIMMKAMNRIMNSDDIFVILATGGLLVMFTLQSFVHMGSCVNLLPTKGMTLPFVSYGGSSLLSSAIMAGIILSLTREQKLSFSMSRRLKLKPSNVRPGSPDAAGPEAAE